MLFTIHAERILKKKIILYIYCFNVKILDTEGGPHSLQKLPTQALAAVNWKCNKIMSVQRLLESNSSMLLIRYEYAAKSQIIVDT